MDIEALAKQAGLRAEWHSGAASCVWTEGVAGVSAEQLTALVELVVASGKDMMNTASQLLSRMVPLLEAAARGDQVSMAAGDLLHEVKDHLRGCDAQHAIAPHSAPTVIVAAPKAHTGFHDRTGKAILVGDVFEFKHNNYYPAVRSVVEWDERRGAFIHRWKFAGGAGGSSLNAEQFCEHVVVGNVFDDPSCLYPAECTEHPFAPRAN